MGNDVGVGDSGRRYYAARAGAFHEIGPQRLGPVRDGVDLLVLEQDFRLFLHIGLEVAGEAGADLDARQRRGEYVERHLVALVGVEPVDDVGDLFRIVLEILRHVEPGFEIGDDGVGLLLHELGRRRHEHRHRIDAGKIDQVGADAVGDGDDVVRLDVDHGVDRLGGERGHHVVHVHADFLVIALLQAVLRHDGVDEDVADRRAGLVGDLAARAALRPW